MPQKIKHTLKHLERLPKQKLRAPSSPKEAKEWLRDVANQLSRYPNAGPRLRFHALAIKKFLRAPGRVSLIAVLGLKPQENRRRGRPPILPNKIEEICNMLDQRISSPIIAQTVGVSKRFIETISAELNALRGKRQHGAKPDTFSWEYANERASRIPKKRLQVLRGQAITAKDILS